MIEQRKRRTRPSTARSTTTANPHAGEHTLTLAGVDYLLRPSHAAIVAIEQGTGATLLQLVRDGNVGALSQQDLGVIAQELIRAGAGEEDTATRHVGAAALEKLIYTEGTAKATIALALCLSDAASGGRTASGERVAPAA